MKAVLEFSYPEDERKLLHALRGHDMYVALADIQRLIETEFHEGNEVKAAVVLARVWDVTDRILKDIGDV